MGSDDDKESDDEKKILDIFTTVELDINTKIPAYLQAILLSAGFNDVLTLSSVYDSIDTISDFVDSEDGLEALKETMKLCSVKNVDKKYKVKPSAFLKVPGNKARLKGIQDYYLKKSSEKKVVLKDRMKKGATSLATSHQSAPPIKITDDDLTNLQRALKNVESLNVPEGIKITLVNPTIRLYTVGDKKQAEVTCIECDTTVKDRACTAYAKGKSSWTIANYTRHINRCHLKKTCAPQAGSLDKFLTKSDQSQVSNPGEDGHDFIIDDEEQDKREDERNFLDGK